MLISTTGQFLSSLPFTSPTDGHTISHPIPYSSPFQISPEHQFQNTEFRTACSLFRIGVVADCFVLRRRCSTATVNHCVRRYTKHWNNKTVQLIWRDHLGDLRVDGKIILNWISKYSVDSSHTDQRQSLVNRAMNV